MKAIAFARGAIISGYGLTDMKKLISFLYRRFVGEPYLTHNSFPVREPELNAKNIKGKITLKKDERGRFEWLEIEQPEGFSSWEYFKYPFWKFSRKHPKAKVRIHNFAYELDEVIGR